ncbi:MAG: zinc ribbon domain-containing protein [Candidatus Thorarchaeota archaeon]
MNPALTSQKCSSCGELGHRVKVRGSTKEERGGEYSYCSRCKAQLHADVNAARNILRIQTKPSAVSGRTV